MVSDKGTCRGSVTHASAIARPQLPGAILSNIRQLQGLRGLCGHLTLWHGRSYEGVLPWSPGVVKLHEKKADTQLSCTAALLLPKTPKAPLERLTDGPYSHLTGMDVDGLGNTRIDAVMQLLAD